MIKTFCDNCGLEMIGSNDPTLLDKLVLPVSILGNRVTAALKIERPNVRTDFGARTIQHVCFGCIADAMKAADKREKPPEAPLPVSAEQVHVWLTKNGWDLVPKAEAFAKKE